MMAADGPDGGAKEHGLGSADEGSVVPVMVAVLAVTCVIGMIVTAWGGGLVRAAQARSAADLAALAAAQLDRDQRARGVSPDRALVAACARATDIAVANGASLDSCTRAVGHSVVVEVTVAAPRGLPAATAIARAGPRM